MKVFCIMATLIEKDIIGNYSFVRLASGVPAWHEKYSEKQGGTAGKIYIAADELASKALDFAEVGSIAFDTCTSPYRYVKPSGEESARMEFCKKEDCIGQIVTRCDTGDMLSMVGNQWTPFQNKDALQNIQVLLDTGLVKMDTAFAISSGQNVVYCCSLAGSQGEVRLGDEITRYFTLSVPHCVGAIVPFFTTIRTVCNNTLQAGMSAASAMLRIRHSEKVTLNVETAMRMINVAQGEFQADLEMWKKLQNVGFNADDVAKYVMRVFDVKDGDEISTKKQTSLVDIVRLASQGKGNTGKTLWDAFNAITEYESHNRGRTVENRMSNLYFGGENGKNIKRALEVAKGYISA